MVGIDRRAIGRAHALHRFEILDCHGHAREDPAGILGPRPRPVEAKRRQGIDLAIDFRHPRFQRIETVFGCDLSGLQHANNGTGGLVHEFHGTSVLLTKELKAGLGLGKLCPTRMLILHRCAWARRARGTVRIRPYEMALGKIRGSDVACAQQSCG